MSIDFNIVCVTCKLIAHLGQDSGGAPAFGYSSNDELGRMRAAAFAFKHAYGHAVHIRRLDDCPTREDGYRTVNHEDIDPETGDVIGLSFSETEIAHRVVSEVGVRPAHWQPVEVRDAWSKRRREIILEMEAERDSARGASR